jgi:hypothetical protein
MDFDIRTRPCKQNYSLRGRPASGMLFCESALIGPSSSLAYDEQTTPSEADVASASEEVVFEGRSVSSAVPTRRTVTCRTSINLLSAVITKFGRAVRTLEDQGECSERDLVGVPEEYRHCTAAESSSRASIHLGCIVLRYGCPWLNGFQSNRNTIRAWRSPAFTTAFVARKSLRPFLLLRRVQESRRYMAIPLRSFG